MSSAHNTVIWKYRFRFDSFQTLVMPEGAQPLSVAMQGFSPVLWAAVDPIALTQPRTFAMLETGHKVSGFGNWHYLGTVQSRSKTVYHIFEVS